jgi:hypothetical protein
MDPIGSNSDWLGGSLATKVGEAPVSAHFAFLAGGVVLKKEVPEESQRCFSAFVLGAAACSILLLLL